MNSQSLLYSMIIILCLFFLYSNIKSSMKNKKENMKVLYQLNYDDIVMRNVSRMVLVFMIFSTFVTFQVSFASTGINTENIFMLLMPLLLVVLYLPLAKKTRITNLGVLKRNSLVRWENIKGIDYLKPDAKQRIKVKLLHKTSYNKDAKLELIFKSGDDQLDIFKNTAKEYRNKKKDKKVEK